MQMKTQKIVNLLDSPENEYSKLKQKIVPVNQKVVIRITIQ